MRIYDLLKVASRLVSLVALIMVVWYIWNAVRSIFNKERTRLSEWFETAKLDMQRNGNQHRWALVLACSMLAYLITNSTVHQLVGVHNLELKPNGTYCFYVEATRSGGKTYTLPAQIRVEKETEEVAEGKSRTYTYYYVEKVFFSNGGWLDFEHEDSVDINDTTLMCNDEDEWRIRLLNEHAYSPYVTETSNAESDDIAWLFVETIPVLFLLCACLIPLKETEEE